jgi:hypothetical protein
MKVIAQRHVVPRLRMNGVIQDINSITSMTMTALAHMKPASARNI